MLVDTHAHLNFPDYEKDLEEVIKRAQENGVEKIICVSSNVGDSEKSIEIGRKYPGIAYPAIGIHPQQTDPENTDSPETQIEKLSALATDKKVVAIGECGLDYSPAPPGEKDRPKALQLFLFEKQIQIAKGHHLPIIIHSREAFTDTIKILEKYLPLQGVFHCYAGGKKGIEKVQRLSCYFGVDGNLTYNEGLQNVFKLIPLEKIVLETDCPFLAPTPFRGKRNEPAYLRLIAEALAKIKNTTLTDVCRTTKQNSQALLRYN